MIKGEVTVVATIARNAVEKKNNDGNTFLSFPLELTVKGRDNTSARLIINVSCDGDKGSASVYTEGRKVEVLGNLNVIKKNGTTYYNLRADGGIELKKSTEKESITGTLIFKGKLGKKPIDTHTDKHGKLYETFSGFSTDKFEENREYTWVRFLNFAPAANSPVRPENYVEINGDLQFSCYKETISIDCRVSEVKQMELSNKQ